MAGSVEHVIQGESMRPHTSYLICATPRSGSFLLGEALINTGIAGCPGEYFWRGDEPGWRERWHVSTYAGYLTKAIEQGSTPNGVFGAKIMWGYFDDFVTKLRQLPQYTDIPVSRLMATVFPNLSYVYMTRRDKVRQAVSHWKALQTNVWGWTDEALPAPTDEPVFDFDEIDGLVQEIITHEAAWQQYFADCSVTPFTVVYEDLVPAYHDTARRILEFLHVPIPTDLAFGERRMKKQADALSEEWVQRYCETKGINGWS
jgi:LPS sulfotransferase NodH